MEDGTSPPTAAFSRAPVLAGAARFDIAPRVTVHTELRSPAGRANPCPHSRSGRVAFSVVAHRVTAPHYPRLLCLWTCLFSNMHCSRADPSSGRFPGRSRARKTRGRPGTSGQKAGRWPGPACPAASAWGPRGLLGAARWAFALLVTRWSPRPAWTREAPPGETLPLTRESPPRV